MKTDSAGNFCPFCTENGVVTIIDQNDVAYLVQVVKDIDGTKVTLVGRYFIIPKQHIESIFERPDDWTKHENELLRAAIVHARDDAELMMLLGENEMREALDPEDSFNTSSNNGTSAGQLVMHWHLWVLFRFDNLKKGLDGTIEIAEESSDEPEVDRAIDDEPVLEDVATRNM